MRMAARLIEQLNESIGVEGHGIEPTPCRIAHAELRETAGDHECRGPELMPADRVASRETHFARANVHLPKRDVVRKRFALSKRGTMRGRRNGHPRLVRRAVNAVGQ